MKIKKQKSIISKLAFTILLGLLIICCETSKLNETPIENFIGNWELQGRTMFNGINIKIEKSEKGELIGKIIKINENKYVKMLVDSNETWVTEIKRSSNFEFKLTEKKIGSALFALYGQETTTDFNVQFKDENTFGLSTGKSDPTKSSIIYKRLKE
ncbi:MAG: hypothetical protein U0W24_08495 [Bacteroidales bacterium]